MAITTHTDEKHGPCKVAVTANNNNDVLSGANKCVVFDLPHNLIKGKLTPDFILVRYKVYSNLFSGAKVGHWAALVRALDL